MYFKTLLGGKATLLGRADIVESNGVKYASSALPGYVRQTNIGKLYPAGIETAISAQHTQYTKPAANTRRIGLLIPAAMAPAIVIADGLDLNANLTILGNLSSQNKFTFDVNPQKLALKLNPANGLVTGTIVLPNGKKSKIKALVASSGDLHHPRFCHRHRQKLPLKGRK